MSSVYYPTERPTGDARRRLKKAIAATELLLISPAVVFMIAILLLGTLRAYAPTLLVGFATLTAAFTLFIVIAHMLLT